MERITVFSMLIFSPVSGGMQKPSSAIEEISTQGIICGGREKGNMIQNKF
jgi:hypothetical protein